MDTIEILMLVIFAHYLADYPLQGDFLGTMKGKYDYLLFCHCVIWTGCVSISLAYFGLYATWKLLFLFIGHFIIDRWKARHPSAKEIGLTKLLWIDQLLHFVQILICVFI